MNEEIKQYLQPGRKNLILIYVLYLCGIVLPLLMLFAAIGTYLNRNAPEALPRSHYIFLLRTFGVAAIGWVFEIISPYQLIDVIVHMAWSLWFIVRIIVGFKYLLDNEAHPNPQTWWIR